MRRRFTAVAIAAVLFGTAETARPEVQLADMINVLGSVTSAARPIENAIVIALNLSTYTTTQTFSDRAGKFRLPPLRSGVYRIIALKSGFAPNVATVVPLKREHDVTIRLSSDKQSNSAVDEIWKIRSSLPSDILREIDAMYATGPVSDPPASTFRGEMVSMTAVSPDLSTPYSAQTAVGLRGELATGWTVDFAGKFNRLGDDYDANVADPDGESSGVVMQVSPGPGQAYRIASSRSSWRKGVGTTSPAADLQTHNIEWQGQQSSVRFRYLAQENLFRSTDDTERLQLEAEHRLYHTGKNDLTIGLRLGQETIAQRDEALPYRTADVSASGEYRAHKKVALQYGLDTRVSSDGVEWTPRSGALITLKGDTALLVSGRYKLEGAEQEMPAELIVWSDPSGYASPRYAYSIGILSGDGKHGTFKAIGTVTAFDGDIRMVFDDGIDAVWQGLWFEAGDVRRDVTLSYTRKLSETVAVDVTTTAGTTSSELHEDQSYVIGSLQSLYIPSGTSIELTYRGVEHAAEVESLPEDAPTRRLNIQMGQSLRLPLDVRLLVGIELGNSEQSSDRASLSQRRYLGGVSFAF